MFDRFDIRYKIVLIWILAFTTMWITFQSILPSRSIEYELDKIEESIEKGNWVEASKYTAKFKEDFKKSRMFIQMNNATEAFTNFEHTVGQLDITVKHKQDSALEYIGALRETIDLVIKPFSGP